MKLLSILLLASVFAAPVAALADPSQAKAGSPVCPFAENTVKQGNALDAKSNTPKFPGSSKSGGRAIGGVQTQSDSAPATNEG